MNKFRFYLLGLSLAATISMTASDKPARQMNYWPDGRDIVCVNGQNKYTRALYGTHTYWRLETSDRPIFATVNNKKDCRNIQLYLIYNKGEQNLTDATFCEARYRGGRRIYLLRDGLRVLRYVSLPSHRCVRRAPYGRLNSWVSPLAHS